MVDGGANRPSGIEHIVEENNDLVGDIEGNARVVDIPARQERVQVIAVERDIHFSYRNVFAFPFFDHSAEALRHTRTSGSNPNEDDLLETSVLPHNLSGKAFEDLLDLYRVQDAFLLYPRILHWRL